MREITLLGGPAHGRRVKISGRPSQPLRDGETLYYREQVNIPLREREGWESVPPSPMSLVRPELRWVRRFIWCTAAQKESLAREFALMDRRVPWTMYQGHLDHPEAGILRPAEVAMIEAELDRIDALLEPPEEPSESPS